MKSLILLVPLLCLILSPTTTIGGWPKPSEISNEEMLMNTKLSFGDSKIWKCVYNNGSGAAISISYPSPPHSPSPKPSTPSSPPLTPKMYPPPPKPSLPPPLPKMSPPPPKPSPPPPKLSPPPPKPSPPPPTPKKSPPPSPPKPSTPPPSPKISPSAPTLSPPHPKPLPPIRHSPPTPKTYPPPPPNESTPSPPPSTPAPRYQNPWGHFISCVSDFGPSAICKQQMEVSYYTGRFRVSDYCCNLIVNMRNECTDVILGYYTDPFFVPLIRYTCHVKN